MKRHLLIWVLLQAAQSVLSFQATANATTTLESELLEEDQGKLASAAMTEGDPRRGAVLFHQQQLACTTCHSRDGSENSLGPDLTTMGSESAWQDRGQEITGNYLVESLLNPAKVIRKSFAGTTIQTDSGILYSGIIEEESNEEIVLRDVSQNGKRRTIAKEEIEERWDGLTLMPTGLVSQLAGRQQFLDLVRYLSEIAKGGVQRAQELQPPDSAINMPPLPSYEQDIDHSGLISSLDEVSLERGANIYNRLCINCHGSHKRPGSLPTSLKFASGVFKNGSDPYRMYQTLTHGFGMMVAQRWMVPQQKYDVIHYIREAYLRKHNPLQYQLVDSAYLASLPQGADRGPPPQELEPWSLMDYGPSLHGTFEIALNNSGEEPGWDLGEEADPNQPNNFVADQLEEAELQRNIAYKGIAVRLDLGPGGIAQGSRWIVYDHDTMHVAGAWSGTEFIDFNSIHFNGKHAVHPRLLGKIEFANPTGPGWANPRSGSFGDPRPLGRDGRPYGPLPPNWMRYRGLYHHGEKTLLSYEVGNSAILELPGSETLGGSNLPVFTRTFEIERSSHDLQLVIAPATVSVVVLGGDQVTTQVTEGTTIAKIVASTTPQTFKVLICDCERTVLEAHAKASPPAKSLRPLTLGGPPRWPEIITTQFSQGKNEGPFAVDELSLPDRNPWNCRLRMTGLDFYSTGDAAAICSWDGDVWLIQGLQGADGELRWQRIASGLFQPLGLKIVDGVVHVTCRDQLVSLRDLNQDGETDFYECFNNDHQVTEHFHEFAMGLQTDAEGNFYYAKAARHAKKGVVPHHGTLLRVSPDGLRTDILATGLRAANGVCLNQDGSFFVTDQEGHWNPKNRLNWVVEGGFYGNMYGYHHVTDASDDAMLDPMCWITNSLDRSPAEMLWVPNDAWGSLGGSLLNLSYGTGRIHLVPHEKTSKGMQGGMCELPIPQFPTGITRGRFHPQSNDLYVCGMFAWAGNQQQPGGFYRIRRTDQPVCVPLQLQAKPTGLTIHYSSELERISAQDARNYTINTWTLKRTANYGSAHYDETTLVVESAKVSADGQTVQLSIPDIRPICCMRIQYRLQDTHGELVQGEVHSTIHELIP